MTAPTSFDDAHAAASTVDLTRSMRVLRRNAWLPILLALIGGAGAYARAASQPNVYTSNVVVRVSDPTVGSTLQRDRVDPVRQVDIQVLYAKSAAVTTAARASLGDDADRVRRLKVVPVTTADAIELRAESTDREVARRAARSYADAYIGSRRGSIAEPLLAQAKTLRDDAARLRDEVSAIDDRVAQLTAQSSTIEAPLVRSLLDDRVGLVGRATTLGDRATQLEVEASVRQSELGIIEDAELAESPTSPKPVRDAGIGLALALLLGLVLAVPFDRWRDRVWSAEDIDSATLGLQVLATIPSTRTRSRSGRAKVAEAYRTLRASVLFGASGPAARSMLVAGAGAGGARSTVAANLAIALAQSGASVAYVDADLRERRSPFATPAEGGLTSFLLGDVAAPVLHRVDIRSSPVAGHLDVVAAGEPVPDAAADLLTSPRLRHLIDGLLTNHQHVVINGASLGSAADSLNVACLVDAVVLVAAQARTRRRELWTSVSCVLQLGAPLKGLVLDASAGRGNLVDMPAPTTASSPQDAPTVADRV